MKTNPNPPKYRLLPASLFFLLLAASFPQAQDVIYESEYTRWKIYDASQYTAYRANMDDIIGVLDRAIPGIMVRLGVSIPLPVTVNIEEGDGLGGWAGGGQVGYTMGCFKSTGGMNWVRGVVIGEVVNVATGVVASEWPRDWWVNGVWYFPGMVVVDVLAEFEGQAASEKWETDEHYPTYPVYNLFKSFKDDNGWEFYVNLMDLVEGDNMTWSRQGFGANPSSIRTNYVIAYLSLTAGRNLAQDFIDIQINEVDEEVIQQIMDVRQRLKQADADGVDASEAWNEFRNAGYGAAAGILDDLGITALASGGARPLAFASSREITVHALDGGFLYAGERTGWDAVLHLYAGRMLILNGRLAPQIGR